jgi:hypothetical protein
LLLFRQKATLFGGIARRKARFSPLLSGSFPRQRRTENPAYNFQGSSAPGDDAERPLARGLEGFRIKNVARVFADRHRVATRFAYRFCRLRQKAQCCAVAPFPKKALAFFG